MAKSINKLVEKKAFDELELLIAELAKVQEALLKTSEKGREFSKTLKTPTSNNDALNKHLKDAQDLITKLTADYKAHETTINSLQSKITQLTQVRQAGNKTSALEAINQKELKKSADAEAVAQSNLTTYIQKISVERAKHSKVVADMNAKLQMGIALSEKEQQQLTESTAAFTKYDAAIKAGKQSIGDMREYVGQYERANWGLNNSINQITRELPAFTYNAQTGFLAISNNIPALVDEINKLKDGNKALIAQGEPVKNVALEIGKAFFSWNTVISLAITLTTVFVKEIGAFFTNLFKTKSAMDGLLESTKEYVEKNKEFSDKIAQSGSQEISIANKLFAIAKNRKVSDKERKKAIDELIKRYPTYLGNLKEEEFLTERVTKAQRDLIKALHLRAFAIAAQESLTENLKKQIQAEVQYAKMLSKSNDEQDLYNKKGNQSAQIKGKLRLLNEEELESVEMLKKANKENTETTLQGNKKVSYEKVNEITLKNKALLPLKEEERILQSIFDFYAKYLGAVSEDTAGKNKAARERVKVLYDSTESEKRLRIAILERQKAERADRMNNEDLDWEARMRAAIEYYDTELELLERNREADAVAIEQEILHTDEKNRVAYANAVISREEYNNNVAELGKILINRLETSEMEYSVKLNDIVNARYDFIREADNHYREQMNIAYDQQIEAEQNVKKAIFENTNVIRKERLKAHKEYIELTKKQMEADMTRELAAAQSTPERLNIMERYKVAFAELEIQAKNTAGGFETLFQKLGSEILKTLDDLESFTNVLFENSIKRYDALIAKNKEYYDVIISNSEKGSEQEQRLIEEKEAKEEWLRKKRIDAEIRAALAKKAFSLIDIKINTALALSRMQAAAAILPIGVKETYIATQTGLILGQAALQTATVLAQPLPQYKHGRKGGKAETAVVGDGYVSEVLENPKTGEIRVTPNKPTITRLAEGEIVHKSIEDFQKNKLNIQKKAMFDSMQWQYISLKHFDSMLTSEFRGISDKIEKGIERGFKKAKINNYVNLPKFDVSHEMYRRKGLTS